MTRNTSPATKELKKLPENLPGAGEIDGYEKIAILLDQVAGYASRLGVKVDMSAIGRWMIWIPLSRPAPQAQSSILLRNGFLG